MFQLLYISEDVVSAKTGKMAIDEHLGEKLSIKVLEYRCLYGKADPVFLENA